ncbi:MAG TPA: GNAT family N-acetyltransferase [Anaerolineales bacterium]|jgi:ribosomal-protein-serine acetyltransferase|nr:GNAT family N-acetyltransferase [Anaerolineales bacterium]
MLSSTRLTDEDLLLRPFHLTDSAQLYCAVKESLAELKPWMSWAMDEYSEQTAREYITIARIRWEEHTFYGFAITRGDDFLGACTLSSIHPIYHFCNLGYWVRTSCRGQGIAGRAAKLAARFAFEHVGLIRVEIVIGVRNHASLRVAQKIGAHDEGILLNRLVVGTSIYDAHMYSLLPSDFGLKVNL